MDGFPDEVFQHDVQSFPREDPKVSAARQKEQAAIAKEVAAEQKKARDDVKKLTTAMKKAPAPKTAEAAAPTTDAKRLSLKARKITLYFTKFGERLSISQPKTLPKTEEGLDELLATIEAELHSEGGIKQAGALYLESVRAFTAVTDYWNPLNLQLRGPACQDPVTVFAANRKLWDDVVTECAIAHAEWFMVGPVKRLLMTTVQIFAGIDAANKTNAAAKTPASDKLKDEAGDL